MGGLEALENLEEHSQSSVSTFNAPESVVSVGMATRAYAHMMSFATRDLLALAVFLRWNRVCPKALPSNVTNDIVGFFLLPHPTARHKQQRVLCRLMLQRPRIYGQQLLPSQTIDTDTSV